MKKLMLMFPIISGGLWGSAGIFVRKLSYFGVNSYTIISSRVLIALIILFIGILLFDKSLLKIKLKDVWIFIASGVLGMLGLNFCYNESVNQLSLSLAAVLLSLSPIFVIFFAAILFKEKITLRKVSCMLLAILGCLLASGILENTTGMKWSAIGILIGILSAFFYALYSVMSKVAMGKGYQALTITFYSLVTLEIVLLPITDLIGILSAFFYALYSVMSKVAMGKGYQALTITFYSLVTLEIVLLPITDWHILKDFVISSPINNSIFMLLNSLCTSVLPYVLYTLSLTHIETGKVSILASGDFVISSPINNSIFMLLNSLCTSVLPYVLYTLSLTHIETGKVSILASGGEPIAAMLLGMLFFSEIPTILSLIGLILTIIALSLLCMPTKDKTNELTTVNKKISI